MPIAFREKIAAQPPQKWNPSGVDDAISSSRDIFAAVRAATLDNDRFFKYVTVWFSFCRKSGQYYSTGVEGAIGAGWNPDEVIANLYPHWSLIGNNSYTVDNVHTLLAVIGNTKRYFFDEPRRFSRLSGFSSNYYMQNPFPLGTDRHNDLQNLLSTLHSGAQVKGVPFGVGWGVLPEDWNAHYVRGDTSVVVDGQGVVDSILGGAYDAWHLNRLSTARIYEWFYGSENNPAFGAKFDTISFSIWELGYAMNFLLNKYREQAQIDILTDPWGCFDTHRPFNGVLPDRYYDDKIQIKSQIVQKGTDSQGRKSFPDDYEWWKVPRVNFSVEKYMGDALRYVWLYMIKPDYHSYDCPESGLYFVNGDGSQFGTGEDYRQYLMAAYEASPGYPEA